MPARIELEIWDFRVRALWWSEENPLSSVFIESRAGDFLPAAGARLHYRRTDSMRGFTSSLLLEDAFICPLIPAFSLEVAPSLQEHSMPHLSGVGSHFLVHPECAGFNSSVAT